MQTVISHLPGSRLDDPSVRATHTRARGMHVIVQARKSSSRLPNKIASFIGDMTVLEHVLDRCKAIPSATSVTLATVDDARHRDLAGVARSMNVNICFGPEHDVLKRFADAAGPEKSETVARVTADCPAIDPSLCEQLYQSFTEHDVDYACLAGWPHGLDFEIFRKPLLMEADKFASSPVDREHATLWFQKQPHVKGLNLAPARPFSRAYRLVVDYPEDLDFFQKLAAQSGETIPRRHQDIVALLDAQPDLLEINRDCAEKWAKKDAAIRAESAQSAQ